MVSPGRAAGACLIQEARSRGGAAKGFMPMKTPPLANAVAAAFIWSRSKAMRSGVGSGPSAKLVHEAQDAFPDFKQLLARLGNHDLGQKFLHGHGLQPGLRLV